MVSNQLVMHEEELEQIGVICQQLNAEANARAVLVIDRDGIALAQAGEIDSIDITSLASLVAGNVASAGGIANLLAEKEFAGQFHEGEHTKVLSVIVGGRVILVVLFDHRSNLGLVRLRMKKSSKALDTVIKQVLDKSAASSRPSVLGEITDEDIDNLFSD